MAQKSARSRSKSPAVKKGKATRRDAALSHSPVALQPGSTAPSCPQIGSNNATNATFVFYAMLAGTFGALSGVAGKLSVSDAVSLAVYFRLLTFAANGFCTAQMWRYYLKALSLGSTPTCQVINTATNFIVSAVVGFAVFGEEVNAFWALGAFLVVGGLGLIVSDPGIPQPT